jgi:phosphatidylglycerophosphatase A
MNPPGGGSEQDVIEMAAHAFPSRNAVCDDLANAVKLYAGGLRLGELPLFGAKRRKGSLGSALGGVWITGRSAERLGVHDHSGIVWDEIAAFLALALFLPAGWLWLAAGFIAFRCFDIFKPWPIRDLDHRLNGGLGIMLDDLAAAAFSAAVLRLLEYLATHI